MVWTLLSPAVVCIHVALSIVLSVSPRVCVALSVVLSVSPRVCVTPSAGDWDMRRPGVTAVAHPASMGVATNHGVFVVEGINALFERYKQSELVTYLWCCGFVCACCVVVYLWLWCVCSSGVVCGAVVLWCVWLLWCVCSCCGVSVVLLWCVCGFVVVCL